MNLNKKLITLIMAVATLTISGCGVANVESSSPAPSSRNDTSSYTPVTTSSNGGNNQGTSSTPVNNGNDPSNSSEPSNNPPADNTNTKAEKVKKAFKKLDNLSDYNVNIYDATSLGLSKNSKAARKLRKRLGEEGNSASENSSSEGSVNEEEKNLEADEEFETTFSLVKTTSENKTDATVNEDGTLDVSFSKIDTTVTTKNVEGQRKLIATHEKDESDEVTIKEYGTDTITFNSDEKHEYRVVDALGNVHQDWIKGNEGTTTTDHLPINDSRGWDDFILYEREVEFNSGMTYNISYGADYIGIYYWNSVDEPTQSRHYEYRILDGDEDHVVMDWTQFPDNTENEGASTLKKIEFDPMPETPIVQYRGLTRKKVIGKGVYTSVEFLPVGNDSISFVSRGKCGWSSESVSFAQYCLEDKGGNVIVDWTGNPDDKYGTVVFNNIPYVEPKAIDTYQIESRSLDANISFTAYDGFKYSIIDNEGNVILDKVETTSEKNISKDESIVTFGGLRDGDEYILKYEGVGEEVVVEQTKIGGEIDKMYVYSSRFTFASFVPYGTSERPGEDELKYGKDGIAFYDKTDYYSSESRLSFIFDNYSGYIYLIDNFNISEIQNGLLTTKDNNLIYDFKIDDENNLVIYPLYSNPSIICSSCIKDKYGNIFIRNNIIDEYFEETNTMFYVSEGNGATSSAYYGFDISKDLYFVSPQNEVVKAELYGTGSYLAIKHAYVYTGVNETRKISVYDDFCITDYNRTLLIRNGYATILPISSTDNFFNGNYYREVFITCLDTEEVIYLELVGVISINPYYLEKYNIMLLYNSNDRSLRSWEFKDIRDYTISHNISYLTPDGDSIYTPRKVNIEEATDLILSNTTINDARTSFVNHSINGTTSYDIVVEEKDGEVQVNKYVTGTYEAPVVKVVLQPINR